MTDPLNSEKARTKTHKALMSTGKWKSYGDQEWLNSKVNKFTEKATIYNYLPNDVFAEEDTTSWFPVPLYAKCLHCGGVLGLYVDESYMGDAWWTHLRTEAYKMGGAAVNNHCPQMLAKAS